MDYKYSCVIDALGLYVTLALVLLPEDEDPRIEGYTIKSGERLIDALPPVGFVKARWTGAAWVEGATAKEIAVWEEEHPAQEPVVSPPSQLDSVEAQSIYTAMMTDTLLEG